MPVMEPDSAVQAQRSASWSGRVAASLATLSE
jgi:hypothetical protein